VNDTSEHFRAVNSLSRRKAEEEGLYGNTDNEVDEYRGEPNGKAVG